MLIIALFLGILQGLTEFLPVSSSGHLAIARMLFPDFTSPGILFEILLHLATATAVIVFSRKEIAGLLASIIPKKQKEHVYAQSTDTTPRQYRYLALMIFIATVPTAIIGYSLKNIAESSLHTPFILVIGYTITTSFLLLSLLAKRKKITLFNIAPSKAFIIGIIQGISVIPGISRSGSTIVIALLLGVAAKDAARFSFLIALPAIFGAMLLDIPELLQTFATSSEMLLPFFAAMLLAGTSGFIALKLLYFLTDKWKLHYFAPYCMIIILLILYLW